MQRRFDVHLLQAARIKKVRQLAAQHFGKAFSEVSLPWYIMTSPMTHEATQSYFEEQKSVGAQLFDCARHLLILLCLGVSHLFAASSGLALPTSCSSARARCPA